MISSESPVLENSTPGLTSGGEETWLRPRLRHRHRAKAAGNSYSLVPTAGRASPRLYSGTYQWVRVDGGTETDIPGTPSPEQSGQIPGGFHERMRETTTDDDGYENSVTSNTFPSSGAMGEAAVLPATCGGETVWSATLTVGTRANGNGGFGDLSGTTNDHGSLSDTTFTHDSTDYTVEQLVLGTQTNPTLSLSLDPSAADAFDDASLLCLGSESFRFADATEVGSAFTWSESGLEWEDGARIGVKIVDDTTAPTLESGSVLSNFGVQIWLVFDEELDGSSVPPPTERRERD